jgi:hypothetical protein
VSFAGEVQGGDGAVVASSCGLGGGGGVAGGCGSGMTGGVAIGALAVVLPTVGCYSSCGG